MAQIGTDNTLEEHISSNLNRNLQTFGSTTSGFWK